MLVSTVALLTSACGALHLPASESASSARGESPSPIATATSLQLSAPSTNTVWVLVDYSRLYRSADRGITWEQRQVPAQIGQRPKVTFVNDLEGWWLAPGSPATQCEVQLADIWHTTDGGATWRDLGARIDKTQCKNGLWFFDATHGFVAAWDQNHRPTLYRTSDGGDSWSSTILADPAYFKSAPGGFTLQVDWIKQFGATLYLEASGSQDGPNVPHDNQFILSSTDGGASWNYVTKVPSQAVVMVTESRWLDFTTADQPMESTNGGQQFHPYQSDFGARATSSMRLVFADANFGYAVGDDRLLFSRDGGAHWALLPTPGVSPSPVPRPS